MASTFGAGETLGGRYELHPGRLGMGAFGEVRSARDLLTDELVAVKLVPRTILGSALERYVSVIHRLADVRSPNLVSVRDVFIEGESVAVVMEFVDGWNLREFATFRSSSGVLSEAEAASLVAQLLSALAEIHRNGIVHRDVKPENILVRFPESSRPEVVLIDFGIATSTSDTREQSVAGTPYYMAPEAASRGELSPAVDIYATGVVFYELLTGHTPFEGSGSVPAILRRQQDVEPVRPPQISDDLWAVISAMLAKVPTERPEAEVLRSRLLHVLPELDHSVRPMPTDASLRTSAWVAPFLDLPLAAGRLTLEREVERVELARSRSSAWSAALAVAFGVAGSVLGAFSVGADQIPRTAILVAVVPLLVALACIPIVVIAYLVRKRRQDSLSWQALQISGRLQSSYLKALNSVSPSTDRDTRTRTTIW